MSVLIATYNAAGTLPRAIDSALAQTNPPHEIIVCDDGSTDNTAEVLARYGDKIKAIRQPNSGVSAAKNAAGRHATGEWVVFLDADDEWLPPLLARVEDAIAENPSADIISTNAIMRAPGRADRTWFSAVTWPDCAQDQRVAIINGSFIFTGAAVRREAMERIGWFRTDLPHQGEWEGWVRLILTGSLAARVTDPVAIYHLGAPGQLSRDSVGTYRTMLTVLDDVEGKYDPEIDAAVTQSRTRLIRSLRWAEGARAIRQGDRKGVLRSASSPALPVSLRLKFAAAAVAPSLAGRLLR